MMAGMGFEKGKEYGLNAIPTQIFSGPDGKELWRHEGFIRRVRAEVSSWPT